MVSRRVHGQYYGAAEVNYVGQAGVAPATEFASDMRGLEHRFSRLNYSATRFPCWEMFTASYADGLRVGLTAYHRWYNCLAAVTTHRSAPLLGFVRIGSDPTCPPVPRTAEAGRQIKRRTAGAP